MCDYSLEIYRSRATAYEEQLDGGKRHASDWSGVDAAGKNSRPPRGRAVRRP